MIGNFCHFPRHYQGVLLTDGRVRHGVLTFDLLKVRYVGTAGLTFLESSRQKRRREKRVFRPFSSGTVPRGHGVRRSHFYAMRFVLLQ